MKRACRFVGLGLVVAVALMCVCQAVSAEPQKNEKFRLRFIVLDAKPLPGHSLNEKGVVEQKKAEPLDRDKEMAKWAELEKNPDKYLEEQQKAHPGLKYSVVMTGAFTFLEDETGEGEFHATSPEGKDLVLKLRTHVLGRPQDPKVPRQVIITTAFGEAKGPVGDIACLSQSVRIATMIGLPANVIADDGDRRFEMIFLTARGDLELKLEPARPSR
jgi:hypothetical protein